MIENLFLSSVFAIGLQKYSKIFTRLELFLFTAIFYRSLVLNLNPLILAVFFIFVCYPSPTNLVSFPLLLGFNPAEYFVELLSVLRSSSSYLLYLFTVFIIFIISLRITSVAHLSNLSRKLFHFLAFLLLIRMQRLNVLLIFPAVYLSMYLCFTNFIPIYFPLLLKANDPVKDRFSLPILLMILSICQAYGTKLQLFRLLLSICIHDSFASFTGGYLGKKRKSVEGMIIGLLATCFCEHFISGSISLVYHILIALVEYLSKAHDNLSMAICNAIYHNAVDFLGRLYDDLQFN